jgi:hypothetical protein
VLGKGEIVRSEGDGDGFPESDDRENGVLSEDQKEMLDMELAQVSSVV